MTELDLKKDSNARSAVIAVVAMMLIALSLAGLLYTWSSSFLEQGEAAPIIQMDCSKDANGNYRCVVIKVSKSYSMKGGTYSFFLKDETGLSKMFGPLYEIYCFRYGDGKGVVYADYNLDTRLNAGDVFYIYPDEPGSPLEGIVDMDDYKLEIKYNITDSTVGSFKLGG